MYKNYYLFFLNLELLVIFASIFLFHHSIHRMNKNEYLMGLKMQCIGSGTLCCLGATNSSMLSQYIIPLLGHAIFFISLEIDVCI